jgi:hypothetical protein
LCWKTATGKSFKECNFEPTKEDIQKAHKFCEELDFVDVASDPDEGQDIFDDKKFCFVNVPDDTFSAALLKYLTNKVQVKCFLFILTFRCCCIFYKLKYTVLFALKFKENGGAVLPLIRLEQDFAENRDVILISIGDSFGLHDILDLPYIQHDILSPSLVLKALGDGTYVDDEDEHSLHDYLRWSMETKKADYCK